MFVSRTGASNAGPQSRDYVTEQRGPRLRSATITRCTASGARAQIRGNQAALMLLRKCSTSPLIVSDCFDSSLEACST